jgi:hypothetical protein
MGKELIYEKAGIVKAKAIVTDLYPDAKLAELDNWFYITDPRSGAALSPICTGEAPAWRFAALLIQEGLGLLSDRPILIKKEN